VEGFVYSWNHTSIRLLLLLAVCAALLLRPVIELMPAFVGDVLRMGPAALAWLLSSTGAAALLASLWLARRNDTTGLTRHMMIGFLVSGLTIIVFALQTDLRIGVVLMVIFGFTSSMANVSNQILVQVGLDDRIRARVMGIYSLTFRAVPAVGALLVGTIGTVVSLPVPVTAGAALGLLFWIWMVRAIRQQNLEASPGLSSHGK